MKGISLACVLILAKILGLTDRSLPSSIWLPSVLFWDDVLVGVLFGMLDRTLKRPRVMWLLYGAIVVWAALNVPVVRTLSSPLTPRMLAAARGPLWDSIVHGATVSNIVAIVVVVGAAALVPLGLRRVRTFTLGVVVMAVVLVAMPGPLVASRVDTHGLQRNAMTTMVRAPASFVAESGARLAWRESPFPSEAASDLGRWRGAAEGRNVVFIVLESAAARYLRPYGATDDPTPNLTALASKAMVFERAYAIYPESIKGLFAMLCSRSPAFDTSTEAHAKAGCTSMPRLLSESGYRTGLFHSGRFAYLGMEALVSRMGFDTLEDAGDIGGNFESSFGVDEPATVERMLTWVDGLGQGTRFLLTYLPVAGHHPYAVPRAGPFKGSGDLAAYKNAIYDGDRSLGLLLDGLSRRHLIDNTLFVLVGDHGEAFGQHNGNYGHSLQIYDENIRVPLLFVMPRVIEEGFSVPNVASVVDIAPTILELLGLSLPSAYEGESLLSARNRMAFFFTDYSLRLLGLQDGCCKYHLEIDAPRSRLFDTCVDSDETIDLAEQQVDRVRVYRERVDQWSGASRDDIR